MAIDVLKDMDYLRQGLQRIAEQSNGQYLHIHLPRIPEHVKDIRQEHNGWNGRE